MGYEGPIPVSAEERERLRINALRFDRHLSEARLRAEVLRVLGPKATEKEIGEAIDRKRLADA